MAGRNHPGGLSTGSAQGRARAGGRGGLCGSPRASADRTPHESSLAAVRDKHHRRAQRVGRPASKTRHKRAAEPWCHARATLPGWAAHASLRLAQRSFCLCIGWHMLCKMPVRLLDWTPRHHVRCMPGPGPHGCSRTHAGASPPHRTPRAAPPSSACSSGCAGTGGSPGGAARPWPWQPAPAGMASGQAGQGRVPQADQAGCQTGLCRYAEVRRQQAIEVQAALECV